MFIGIIFITGCGNKENKEMESKEPITVATQLSDLFKSEIKKSKDLEKIAQIIAESDIIIPEVQTFSITKDDYLAGFKEDIKGFKKAIGIAPMISTIHNIIYLYFIHRRDRIRNRH